MVVDAHEVEAFLYEEAALLDAWRLDDWLALFTEDCRYIVPSTDLPEGSPERDIVLIDDDWERLRARVERLKSRFAHREYPWSRTRHLITNVRCSNGSTTGDPDELHVSANFVVYRFRGAMAEYVGRYEHRLVRTAGGLRIRFRKAVLDNERLDQHGAVSIIV